MNAQDILHFILSHSEMLIGITIGLALLTVIVILVLPSNESKQSAVDLSGIEEALRRAIEKIPQAGGGQNTSHAVREMRMSSIQDEEEVSHDASNVATHQESSQSGPTSISVSSANAVTGGTIDPVIIDKLKTEISEREKKIKNLEGELAQRAQTPKTGNDSGAAHDDALAKIQELQGKLSEYAIIEEELADISKFKDENAKLKQELAVYRAGAPVAPGADEEIITAQAMPPPPTPAPKQLEDDDLLADVAVIVEPPSEDQVVLEFQAAVENQAVPKSTFAKDVSNAIPIAPVSASVFVAEAETSFESPLDGSLDTSKMLQEIEKLGNEDSGGEDDPMAGLLDTEKLLAEVRELGGPKNASINSEQSAVDDLMSEFEAEQQQIKVKA